MKKLICVVMIAACLSLIFAGCGNKPSEDPAVNNVSDVTQNAAGGSAQGNTETNTAPGNTENAAANNISANLPGGIAKGNTENNAVNVPSENTAANTENTAVNTSGYGRGPEEPGPMDLIAGTWYDQVSYGILKINNNGECEYSSYSGDLSARVNPSELHSQDPMNDGLAAYDLKLSGGMEELPNLFYDEENDVLYLELGGNRNLFSHEPHPYEPIDWVYAMFGEDILKSYADSPEYTADSSEYSRVIIFDTTREVKDFYFTNVSLVRMDDKGQPVFQIEPLFMVNKLEPMKGMVVKMSFPGDTPSNGIMYTDPISGEVRQFTISLSGDDGSLKLTEFH